MLCKFLTLVWLPLCNLLSLLKHQLFAIFHFVLKQPKHDQSITTNCKKHFLTFTHFTVVVHPTDLFCSSAQVTTTQLGHNLGWCKPQFHPDFNQPRKYHKFMYHKQCLKHLFCFPLLQYQHQKTQLFFIFMKFVTRTTIKIWEMKEGYMHVHRLYHSLVF